MITRTWRMLPGPLAVRIVEAVILTVVVLVLLHFFYDWLGNTILDQGGTVE
ncbi:MAG: hypothetical protein QNL12_06845 [Acidimicrobiia bacterium]|nr:hypothetical protein [Acidimicrobiia bacterium]MDX2467012.1 hypothetical protein [Acidimicrobiia bacterium]